MKEEENEQPPILKTWNNLYALVIGFLFVLIVLFYVLTQTFS